MAICNYRDGGLCTHPRTAGEIVVCDNDDSYEKQANQLVERYGLDGAIVQARYYMSGAVGDVKKEWQQVISIILRAQEEMEKAKSEGGDIFEDRG